MSYTYLQILLDSRYVTHLMLSLLVSVLVTSPYNTCANLQEIEWRLCQPRVINLGAWDPRPLQWPYQVYSDPKDWGEYATEKRDDK